MPRTKGKLKSKSQKTNKFSVAKSRLADCLKEEYQKADSLDNTVRGKMTFADAAALFKRDWKQTKN
jgi:hypothetical protein